MNKKQNQSKKQQEEAEKAKMAAARSEMEKMHVEEAAKKIGLENAKLCYEATSGITTHDLKLIKAISPLTNPLLQVLKQTYISQYGQELPKVVTKKTGGNLRVFLTGLLQKPLEYHVSCLKQSMSGMSTDENALIDILCTATTEEISTLKAEYKRVHEKELVDVIQKATSGDFQRYLTILLQATRDAKTTVDEALVKSDALALYAAGQGKTLGCDPQPFIQIIGNRSAAHLKAVNAAYTTTNPKQYDLLTIVEKEFGGSLKRALVVTLESLFNKSLYFAKAFYLAFQGIGCDEAAVMRIIISRRDIDMGDIKKLYDEKYPEKNFVKRLGDELSVAGLSDLARAALYASGEPLAAAAK